MKTVKELMEAIHTAAVNLGMDVSPKDVAFIIAAFLEGMADHGPPIPTVDNYLLKIADEVNSVRNE